MNQFAYAPSRPAVMVPYADRTQQTHLDVETAGRRRLGRQSSGLHHGAAFAGGPALIETNATPAAGVDRAQCLAGRTGVVRVDAAGFGAAKADSPFCLAMKARRMVA
jgi:hypothetical protein